MKLRRHTKGAAQESVQIPVNSPDLVVEIEGNTRGSYGHLDIWKVELQVPDLEHVSLVVDEVDCFKYLGLNLDHGLSKEEGT
jgi:hypothetical protein